MTTPAAADAAPPVDPQQHLMKEAVKGALTEQMEALKTMQKEAIKAADKELKDAAKAKDKKEKKETGVRPRDFILPVIVCIFMSVPVVGIFLPVYFTAGQDYQRGASQLDYTCAITDVPTPIARAWNNVQKVETSTKNATSFRNQLAARSKRPVRFRADRNPPPLRPGQLASTAVSQYLAYQRCACNQIASLVFDDAGSWDCDTGPALTGRNSSSYYEDLVVTFLGDQGGQNMPPPAPPSPPHPPDWVDPRPSPPPGSAEDVGTEAYDEEDEALFDDLAWLAEYYGLEDEEETPEASSPAPTGSPSAAPTPAATNQPPTGEEDAPAPNASEAGRRRLAQSTPAPTPRVAPATTFTGLTYNTTNLQRLRANQEQRLVGYMGLRISVSKVDPQVGTASLSIQAQPFSLYSFPFGFLDRKKIGMDVPKSVSTLTTVLSAINTASASVRHVTGDSAKVISADVTATTVKSLYYYPFDKYTATVEIQSLTSDFNTSSTPTGAQNWRTALLARQRNLAVGWQVTVQEVTDPYDATVPRISPSSDGAGYVRYTITLQRTTFVQFFAIITLIFMWILGTFAVMYAMDAMYLRPRNLAIGEATMFFTAVFAYGNMRNLMPDVPKVGVGVDFFGYIWIVLMLMGTSALIYARVVAQVVHNQPTLWDMVANRAYYLEWKAEQEKKKADEKKKEEEEKQKKEEEKRKKEAEEIEAKRKEADANAAASEARGDVANLQDVIVATGAKTPSAPPAAGPSAEKK